MCVRFSSGKPRAILQQNDFYAAEASISRAEIAIPIRIDEDEALTSPVSGSVGASC